MSELKPYKKCPLCGSSMTPQWVESLGIHKSYCSNNLDCTLHAILLTDEELLKLSPSPWIPCKDRLPEGYGEYLGSTRARPNGWVFVYAPIGWICGDDFPVTHWQPLPAPPDKDEA